LTFQKLKSRIKLEIKMIRKLKSGEYRIYAIKINPVTNKRRNLGTFKTLDEAKNHERQIEYFKSISSKN
jgi:hypothetical protein